MVKWIKSHWKTLASIGCTVAATGALPINPLVSALIGSVCVAVIQNGEAKVVAKKLPAKS